MSRSIPSVFDLFVSGELVGVGVVPYVAVLAGERSVLFVDFSGAPRWDRESSAAFLASFCLSAAFLASLLAFACSSGVMLTIFHCFLGL